MAHKIALMPRLADDVQAICRAHLPNGFELIVTDPRDGKDKFLNDISQVEFVIGFPRNLPPDFWQRESHLKLIQSLSVGTDDVDVAAANKVGIPVATNGGANAISVAEHTILLSLAVYRMLVHIVNRVRAGGWGDSRIGTDKSYEIHGKTAGLLGMGNIGRQVAQRLIPFGAKVVYYDPLRLDQAREKELQVEYLPLQEVLSNADILSLHLPLMPATRHLIGAEQLAMMKKNAILINTARGELIDEDALVKALKEGWIAAAGLDVLTQEPSPADHPLIRMENVIVTPHVAGPTWDSWPRRFSNGFANIVRVANGEAPLWTVKAS